MPLAGEILALVGLRGSGKSTLGRLLAEGLGLALVDLDQRLAELEPGHGADAGEILERIGEERFRDLESRALKACLELPAPFVLATGGGVVEREANRTLLAGSCRCIWLRADPESLCRRVQGDAAERPSLLGLEPLEEMKLIASRRESLYAEIAEFSVDTTLGSLQSVADEIFTVLSR